MENSGLDQKGKEPFFQKLFDSPFVLLVLGIVVMFAFYTIWGLIEIGNLPASKLP